MKFTVQAEFINDEFDFSVPKGTTNVIDPVKPPNQKDIDTYYQSFEKDYAETIQTGSSRLMATASASLVALAALTLY